MAFIPTPYAARSALKMTLFGQEVVNTLWFLRAPSGWNETTLGDLNTDLINWWNTNMAPLLCDDIELVEVNSVDQSSSTGPSITTGTAVPGGLLGVALPGNVCFTVKFTTAGRGRSSRGRNYVSGFRSSEVSGNQVTGTFAQNVVDAYDLLRTAPLLSGAAQWVVVSKYEDGVARTNGYAQPITGVSVTDTNIDSQRRRLTGRGD